MNQENQENQANQVNQAKGKNVTLFPISNASIDHSLIATLVVLSQREVKVNLQVKGVKRRKIRILIAAILIAVILTITRVIVHNMQIIAINIKKKNTENMEYVKACKEEFKDEKEYKIFSQNTVNHSIIRYNKLIKRLYLNWSKTKKKYLKKYIQKDKFTDLWFENVEIELDSLKDFQHRIIMFYLDDCDIQNKNKNNL